MVAAENLVTGLGKKPEVQPILLLVDDHPLTAGIERNYFVGVGFQVILCSSPSEVEQTVRQTPVDLMIVDVNFAKNRGLEMVKFAKSHACSPSLKILVTSVIGSPEVRKSVLKSGADELLLKPAPREKILRSIKRLTSLKSRDGERVKQNFSCVLWIKNQEFQANTLDLSADGVHIGTLANHPNSRPEIQSEIEISIQSEPKEKPIVLAGTVVRHTDVGFGVRFSEMNKPTKRALDKLLLKFSMNQKMSHFYL